MKAQALFVNVSDDDLVTCRKQQFQGRALSHEQEQL